MKNYREYTLGQIETASMLDADFDRSCKVRECLDLMRDYMLMQETASHNYQVKKELTDVREHKQRDREPRAQRIPMEEIPCVLVQEDWG